MNTWINFIKQKTKGLSPAEKLALVQDLAFREVCDEYGNLIKLEETGIITKEQIIELLNAE